MFCTKCGNQVNGKFCNKCGNPMNASETTAQVQPPVQNTYAPTPPQYSTPMPVGGGRNASKSKSKNVIIVAVAALVVLVGSIATFNIVQEKQRQEKAAEESAAEQAEMNAELDAIESVIQSYENAMSQINFDYAEKYCVPGGHQPKNVVDIIPNGSAIVRAAGGILGSAVKFDYSLAVHRGSIEISGNNATFPATESITASAPAVNLSYNSAEGRTIVMKKVNGSWLIESIS